VAMTVEEVAGLLNVSPRHIYQLVQEHKIPHVRIGSSGTVRPQGRVRVGVENGRGERPG
jgi:excisionase family DNA binding protein